MRASCCGRHRRGAALVAVILVLSVVTTIMAVVTAQIVSTRRLLERRQHDVQAAWAARAGVERAVDRILTRPGEWKESTEIMPLAQVKIDVEREKKGADVFRVSCEARYPTNIPNPAVHSLARRCRRIVDGNKVRVEMLPAAKSVDR